MISVHVIFFTLFRLPLVEDQLFRPPDDPNFYHFKAYKLQKKEKREVRCDVEDLNNSPRHFKIINEAVQSQVAECPPFNDGSRSEHAVLSLCQATDYPLNCGILPHNWMAIGDDMQTRCQKNISVDGIFPIATFRWRKMPYPSDNYYRFYDGGHSAIFLGCSKSGAAFVADQWCESQFGVRRLNSGDLIRYFEIGSFRKNPYQRAVIHGIQEVAKSFLVELGQRFEDLIEIRGSRHYFVRPVMDWQIMEESTCSPEFSGPFKEEQIMPRLDELRFGPLSNPICRESSPGQFTHKTGAYHKTHYLINLTLETNCRLLVEIKLLSNDSLIMLEEWGPNDGTTKKQLTGSCMNSICYRFLEFNFNDHGCYQGVIIMYELLKNFGEMTFAMTPFEVCPTTMDYVTHNHYHEYPLRDEYGYSKTINVRAEQCSTASVPKRRLLDIEWTVNMSTEKHIGDVLFFVDNRNCLLQFDFYTEDKGTVSKHMGHICELCEYYAFPMRFDIHECYVDDFVDSSGGAAVMCHCFKWINEYTSHGDKCFEGELIVQSGIFKNHSLIPTNYILYPFDLCAKIKKNQSLPCLYSGYAETNTTVFFTYSRTGEDTSANVKIKISKHCRLHISIKKNFVPLGFNDHMDWGWDEIFPSHYSNSRCSIGNTKFARNGEWYREQICFRFAESRFSDYCYSGVLMLQKSIILNATNTRIQESAIPIMYNLCAPPNDIDPPPLSASYKEMCYAILDAHHTMLVWQNFDGETHYENVTIQIYRSMNCELRMNVVWREKVYKTTFGATNIKVEEQNMNDKICMGPDAVIVCFTLHQQQSTNMGCLTATLHLSVVQRHSYDFYSLLTSQNIHFNSCPLHCLVI